MKRMNKLGFYKKGSFGRFYTLLRKKAYKEELSPIEGAWLDELDAMRSEDHRKMLINHMMVMMPVGGVIIKGI